MSKPKLAIILGSGFSCESGLPSTRDLSSQFLTFEDTSPLGQSITGVLTNFWKDVFGFQRGDDEALPTLEDHFTMLDLAANSGHHLGAQYSPRKLRAIRRMSIHRVFQILDAKYQHSIASKTFLDKLSSCFDTSVITLNWDIVIEKLLEEKRPDYGIDIRWLPNGRHGRDGRYTLLKMHGSSNWMYCDSCRQIYAGLDGKAALHTKAFLEPEDFDLFNGEANKQVKRELIGSVHNRHCSGCGNQLAGRLATFSYRKAFSISQFQTIWERAHRALRKSDRWLFVGYSMPQADFEFKHLLKSAQLGRIEPQTWQCQVILKGDMDASKRYHTFFGIPRIDVFQNGLSAWVDKKLKSFCESKT